MFSISYSYSELQWVSSSLSRWPNCITIEKDPSAIFVLFAFSVRASSSLTSNLNLTHSTDLKNELNFWIMIFLNYSRLTNLPLDPSLVWVTRRNFITKIAIVPNAITSTTPPPIKTAITHDTELVLLPYLLLSTDVDGIVWILVRSVEKETEFKTEPSWTN